MEEKDKVKGRGDHPFCHLYLRQSAEKEASILGVEKPSKVTKINTNINKSP